MIISIPNFNLKFKSSDTELSSNKLQFGQNTFFTSNLMTRLFTCLLDYLFFFCYLDFCALSHHPDNRETGYTNVLINRASSKG